MIAIVLVALLPSCAAYPWTYDWERFPAAWFGANATHWESPSQIAAIGKYALAILGWQHLAGSDNMTAVVYPQLAQAAILKDAHPSLPVFVYTSIGWAFGMNAAVWPLMKDPQYSDFFLQSTHGSFEYSKTNCYQMHTSDKHCIGYFWNFANASARDYYVRELVTPLAMAPTIDGVFFDAFNYAYDIPEVRPWGKPVINIPNCSIPPSANQSAPPSWQGCEVLLSGTLDVARRTTELLNRHGKVPMFANPASFARPPKQKIWLNESRLVKALEGLQWSSYYESFRGDAADSAALSPSGLLHNMLKEASLGVPATVHTYYHKATEDPTPHVAAFLLARSKHWYFLGSTGWWDDSFVWSPLYDACSKCGRPVGTARIERNVLFSRSFEQCDVTLNCTNATTGCVGAIRFQ